MQKALDCISFLCKLKQTTNDDWHKRADDQRKRWDMFYANNENKKDQKDVSPSSSVYLIIKQIPRPECKPFLKQSLWNTKSNFRSFYIALTELFYKSWQYDYDTFECIQTQVVQVIIWNWTYGKIS